VKKSVVSLVAPLLANFVVSATSALAAPDCMPAVEGAVHFKDSSEIFAGAKTPAGVSEKEFFISCKASQGDYKTLIHVRVPPNPSGIVVVEPWHPNGSWTLYSKVDGYETRSGVVNVAVVGNPFILDTIVKPAKPERYADLRLPGKGARNLRGSDMNATPEFEVLGQVGALIKSRKLPGINARKVILGGMSQTSAVVRAYIAYEHSQPEAKSVFDGYFPAQSAVSSYNTALPDLDVPVVELQGEREMVVLFNGGADKLNYRRPDGPLYRLYEVPGMPHIVTRGSAERSPKECTGRPLTDFPVSAVYEAALDALITWVDKGVPAPALPRVETSEDGRVIKRDAYGNAIGGYRTSYLDVPIATYHASWDPYTTTDGKPSDAVASRCNMIGWTKPLADGELGKLYPSHAAYVAKVDKAAADLMQKRLLLPHDAKIFHDEAEAAKIPGSVEPGLK
jgi:hypothetical protein